MLAPHNTGVYKQKKKNLNFEVSKIEMGPLRYTIFER